MCEVVVYHGTISAIGEQFENSVQRWTDDQVPEAALRNREWRDGKSTHHVTLVSPPEMRRLSRKGADLVKAFQEAANEGPAPLGLGLGRVKNVWFIVLSWPCIQVVRRKLGLPAKDLHITVGFLESDIHDVSKNYTTLCRSSLLRFTTCDVQQLLADPQGLNEDLCNFLMEVTELHADTMPSEHVEALLLRARVLGQNKKPKQAEADARLAFSLASKLQQDRVALTLGDALTALGQRDEAWNIYKEALTHCGPARRKLFNNLVKRMSYLALRNRSLLTSPPKFPRTQHLVNLGAATRDDLLFPQDKRKIFINPDVLHRVVIEEKVDGANLGIYIDENWNIVFQNRSRTVCCESAPQWASLDRWLDSRKINLCKTLGQRYAVFGEWMYAKHSIHYTSLPDTFLGFDVYDRIAEKFLSVPIRNAILEKADLTPVRSVEFDSTVMFQSEESFEEDLCLLLSETQSAYYNGPVEGLVLRYDEVNTTDPESLLQFLLQRGKIVRADFSQGIEDHWTHTSLVRNKIIPVDMPLHDSSCAVSVKKYPSTPHLPWSPNVNADDTLLRSSEDFFGKRVIITEKLDGGNCCLAPGGKVFARTHNKEASHWSFGPVKELYRCLRAEYPEIFEEGRYKNAEFYGENMTATHSIAYDRLQSCFYLFAVRNDSEWLPWDEVVSLARKLQLRTVPLVFDGVLKNDDQLRALLETEATLPSRVAEDIIGEGFVIRIAASFSDNPNIFEQNIAKYVRANHIQTSASWRRTCAKAHIKYLLPGDAGEFPMRPPISAQSIQLFVDLDGVLADFDAGVRRICGQSPNDIAVAAMWRAIHSARDFFGSLEWMPGAQALWENSLVHLKPTILSGVPMSDSRWAERQKSAWCARKLGPEVPHIFCASREKSTYSGPYRVLIDDRDRARRPWEAAGGIFILYTTPEQVASELEEVKRQLQTEFKDTENSGEKFAIQEQPVLESNSDDNQTPGPEFERQRCKYKLIILVGLPGSGKSTFGKLLTERLQCERICQDEVGSRRTCENIIGRDVKRTTVVLDRCNVERADRKYWMQLAMVSSKQVAVVLFEPPPDSGLTLANRLIQRRAHPTIKTSNLESARKIVTSFSRKLEVPTVKDDKVDRVFHMTSFDDTDHIIAQLAKH